MPKPSPVRGLHPKTRLREAGRKLIGGRLRDARRLAARLWSSGAPDAVHDLRVASRRLRVALRLFGAGPRAAGARVKELQDALGAVRDVHLQSGWLRSTGLRPLLELRARELKARTAELRLALRAFVRSTAPRIERALESAGGRGRLGGKRMRLQLRRCARKL